MGVGEVRCYNPQVGGRAELLVVMGGLGITGIQLPQLGALEVGKGRYCNGQDSWGFQIRP